jgi:type IV pilus assembly protein PilC
MKTIRPHNSELPSKPLTHSDVHMWSLQLYIMLSSGVPILTALESISGSNLARVAPTCRVLAEKLGQGFRLSSAMKSLNLFNDFIVNLVSVGENTGRLPDVLERGSIRASRRDKVEREVKGALAYPVFLAILSISMAVFMGFYMFPKLLPFLNGLGVPLPWPTQVLIWCTSNLSSFLLIGTILLVFVIHLLVTGTDQRIKRLRQWLLFNAPVIGEINGDRAYSDCMSDLSLLLEAGCDLMTSLKALRTPSADYQQRIDRCIEEVRGGVDFSDAAEISGMFPRKYSLQVKTGVETGNLVKVFRSISEFLDESITMRVGQIVQLLEPAILIFMGFVTGFIVLATFMPLYSMASTSI